MQDKIQRIRKCGMQDKIQRIRKCGKLQISYITLTVGNCVHEEVKSRSDFRNA
jgi:hypothetical protein